MSFRIVHQHPLVETSHPTPHTCDGTHSLRCRYGGKVIPRNTKTYCCRLCDFDLCPECYNTVFFSHRDSTVRHKSKNHQHELSETSSSNWRCDVCKTTVRYSATHYRCSHCDYDECQTCFNKSKEPVVARIPHPHPLVYTNVVATWMCDGSNFPEGCISANIHGKTDLQLSKEGRYRCHSCDFDLCEPCYQYYISLYVKPGPHAHAMRVSPVDNGWFCNGKYSQNGCRENLNGYNLSRGHTHYRCDICDFDLCKSCYEHYHHLKPSLVSPSPSPSSSVMISNNNNNLVVNNIPAPAPSPSLPSLDNESAECIICMDKPRCVTFVHSVQKTGHTCCCEECAAKLTKCPICNLAFDVAIKTFSA